MDAEAVEKAGSRFGSEESCMVYVGEGGRERDCGGRRARRGWKIEIKGRWVIAVAWEAGQDKSNRTGNRNATPSSDHERKNPHGKSPGINSVPRWLEPVCSPIGPIPLVLPVCAPFSFFFFTLSPYSSHPNRFFFFFYSSMTRGVTFPRRNPRRILNFDRQLRWRSLSLSFLERRDGRVDLLAAISIETSQDLRGGRSRLWRRRDEEIGRSI